MATTALQRDAELLSLYTGLPYQSAHHIAGATRRRTPLIPLPSRQQQLLERWLLRRIAWPACDPVRPWGIKWVHPQYDSLTIRFEGDNMAEQLASSLPPRVNEHGEVSGIPGARFSPPSKKGITMILLGTAARIVLTGISPEAWKTALKTEDRYAQQSCYRRSPNAWTD
ncbi:hypothetical protein J7E99_03405 [Streptomyces sp. ISL-44]|uniref:hypothetical protein n=1 Tax=Streptomyces sp. ISL-44 TaxID=2819184 RepID=UPI001BE6BE7B|nr:hypothetical protein [Streptomyces sp. ISL-44]MBT2539775.1 hypothetical protein [Streptomyces sp. ISL-44]